MASSRQLSNTLSELARTMVVDSPIQGILEQLVSRIVEILPIGAAGITLAPATSGPGYVAGSDESALRYEQLQAELGEGPSVAACQSGEGLMVADLRNDDRFGAFGRRAAATGLAAVFTFPLRQADHQLGALDLYRDTAGPLNDDDMAAAQMLADVTAAYVVNAQARADLLVSSERSFQNPVHDALTGLANRILLLERLEHALLRARRSGKIVAILFADLDQFRTITEVQGRQVGDELLIGVAQRLKWLLRPSDTLARLSGAEFVILCEDLDDESQAGVIATRITEALAVPFDLPGAELKVSASLGIAFAGPGEHIPEQLLQDADTAMYQAKRKGGGHHQVIDLREQHLAESRAVVQNDLRGAIGRGELRVDYQPIVRIVDRRVVGAEALLRWDHPTRGLIAPAIVIPVAEQAGLITEIGRWVLEQACADRNHWLGQPGHRELGLDDMGIAVNVSAHQLLAPDFAATVSDVLANNHTRPGLLTLEITESVFVRDSQRALVVLGELKQLGVRLALDDFGTGYTSLSHLRRFPFDIVKIDQAFTTAMTADPAIRAIVTKVIELAHLLGMAVVAEGVETAEQLREVAALSSEFCQGFFLGAPISADRVEILAT
jgi:diguanylate cyclase (GGDEF)-like protein